MRWKRSEANAQSTGSLAKAERAVRLSGNAAAGLAFIGSASHPRELATILHDIRLGQRKAARSAPVRDRRIRFQTGGARKAG